MAGAAGSGRLSFSAADSVALLSRPWDQAGPAAGGPGRFAMTVARLAAPEAQAGVADPEGLSYVRVLGGELRIGSLTRLADLPGSALACGHLAVLREVSRAVADRGLRSGETVGGMLCQADPAVDLAAVFAAVHATVIISGRGGIRAVPAGDFRPGPGRAVVEPGELPVEIRIPVRGKPRL
jgi:aerobic carbon-monoxide dehydrogenase medium subunit